MVIMLNKSLSINQADLLPQSRNCSIGTVVNRKIAKAGNNIILVYNAGMVRKGQKRECEICGGSGQRSFFKGVSRFLLSVEECEECAGTGFQLNAVEDEKENNGVRKAKKKSCKQNKK